MPQRFKEIFLLLEEWKDIVNKSSTDIMFNKSVAMNINTLSKELHKPAHERSWGKVKLLLLTLHRVAAIKKYVSNSMVTIEGICQSDINPD